MNIEITNKAGLKLITGGKVCEEDIAVKPKLQSKIVTENGEVSPDPGYAGLGIVRVEVSGGDPAPTYTGEVEVG